MTLLAGILADKNIFTLIHKGIIISNDFKQNQIQPASLDLCLGEKAWRVRASFIPGEEYLVSQKLERLKLHEINLKDGAVLETGCVYIASLLEKLALPKTISAYANPKSSTGRLDIFTRILCDRTSKFDEIPAGYHGSLYIEISPQTFPIIVRYGSRLSQIRFRQGKTLLNKCILQQLHLSKKLVGDDVNANITENRLSLSVDLRVKNDRPVGYRSKRYTDIIDIDQRDFYNPLDFWEPLYDRGNNGLVLDPGEFYILVSREKIHIPPFYAAEMIPFDPFIGEFRVHYAGFFDPGFGNSETGGKGSRAVLEVRNREVPFILEHGQIIGHLIYESMLTHPDIPYGKSLYSHYQAQGLKLSKHFKESF